MTTASGPSQQMTSTKLQELINLQINKALGGGIPVADIQAVLTAQSTALGAVAPVPTHSRMIEEIGAALNPSQP